MQKKMFHRLFFVCALLVAVRPGDAALLDWLWSERKEAEEVKISNGPLVTIPFEAKTDDEKFLQEASRVTDLIKSSELDTCQHKVVLKIKTSCSAMTEEELAKMSVNLLNCQSAVDGRQIFQCTESMSLKECTGNMDAMMWNAYHMMNNRARAVCMASRRVQFQALSEMTVNKLMSTAIDQASKMSSLLEGQDRLETLTGNTLQSVEHGQAQLMRQQERLKVTQQGIQDFITHNLHELVKEKALIAAGHKELAQMTHNIKDKLDEANNQLAVQSLERTGNHLQLLKDIDALHEQTTEIFARIDSSTERLISQHRLAAQQYEQTLHNLATINQTVSYLMTLLNVTRSEIDERFDWVKKFLGGTGDQVELIYLVVVHTIYLLVGMLFASFLHLPLFSRAALTVVVPLNLVLSYNHGATAALDLAQVTVLLTAVTILNAVVMIFISYLKPASPRHMFIKDTGTRTSACQDDRSVTVTMTGRMEKLYRLLKSLQSSLGPAPALYLRGVCCLGMHNLLAWSVRADEPKAVDTSGQEDTVMSSTRELEEESGDAFYANHTTPLSHTYKRYTPVSTHNLVSEWLQSKTNLTSPALSTSSRTSGSTKVYCSAVCRSGRRCRNVSSPGRGFCHRHLQGTSVAS